MDNLLLMKELDRFYNLWRESTAIYEDWAKQQGLSNNAVMVMDSIYSDRENCTPSSISHKWFIPKQTVNTILRDFEKKEYITLLPHPKDKRNKIIQLTKKGEEVMSNIVLKLKKLEFYTLSQMGKEKVDSMNDRLEEFVRLFREGGRNE